MLTSGLYFTNQLATYDDWTIGKIKRVARNTTLERLTKTAVSEWLHFVSINLHFVIDFLYELNIVKCETSFLYT